MIATELKDPRLGFVTVTRVELAQDLGHARVYVGVLGSEKERKKSLLALQQRRRLRAARARKAAAHPPGARDRLPLRQGARRDRARRAAPAGGRGARAPARWTTGRARGSPAVDGVLVVDKPAGPTSHDIVDRVRRAFGTRRVGHTGTLDPFATGVLPVCVGQATRLARFLSGGEKEYLATVRLGFATTTDDLTGEPLGEPVAFEATADELGRRARVARGPVRPGAARVLGAARGGPPLVRAGAAGRGGRAPGHAGHRARARARVPRRRDRRPGGALLPGHLRPGAGARPGRAARDRGAPHRLAPHPLGGLRPVAGGGGRRPRRGGREADADGAASARPARGDGGRGGPAPRRPRARAGAGGRPRGVSRGARSTGCACSTHGGSCWPSPCPADSRRPRRGWPACRCSTPTSCSWPRPKRRCEKTPRMLPVVDSGGGARLH